MTMNGVQVQSLVWIITGKKGSVSETVLISSTTEFHIRSITVILVATGHLRVSYRHSPRQSDSIKLIAIVEDTSNQTLSPIAKQQAGLRLRWLELDRSGGRPGTVSLHPPPGDNGAEATQQNSKYTTLAPSLVKMLKILKFHKPILVILWRKCVLAI